MMESSQRRAVIREAEYSWQTGRVPTGFWDHPEHRRDYMRWLGAISGFQYVHDWYGLTKKHFDENHGGGLLVLRYNASPLAALKEYLPHVEWQEWLFRSAPQGFWKNIVNRRRYMLWLATKLNIRQPEDWYRVTKEDFHARRGGGFLSNVHHDSPISAVREFLPEYPWKEWRFHSVPKNFWRSVENRHAFLSWLGEQFNLRTRQDWQTLTKQDFYANGGSGLLANYYGDSPRNAAEAFFSMEQNREAQAATEHTSSHAA